MKTPAAQLSAVGDLRHGYLLQYLSCMGVNAESAADGAEEQHSRPELIGVIRVQEQMDLDGAAGSAAAGPLKADSVAVLLGQALQAQDKALLEKCGTISYFCLTAFP